MLYMYDCRDGGIGRHAGLRNQCLWRGGSTPSRGTNIKYSQININQ